MSLSCPPGWLATRWRRPGIPSSGTNYAARYAIDGTEVRAGNSRLVGVPRRLPPNPSPLGFAPQGERDFAPQDERDFAPQGERDFAVYKRQPSSFEDAITEMGNGLKTSIKYEK